MTATSAHTARRAHACTTCNWYGGGKSIAAGHRYLRHVGFPGDEGVNGDRPWVLRECIACATDTDDFAPVEHGACGAYCCGTTPCALPFQPPGKPEHVHSCQKCVPARVTAAVSP